MILTKNIKNIPIFNAIIETGGKCYIHGGTVRDIIIGITPDDYDILVENVTMSQLFDISKDFGVPRLHPYLDKVMKLHTREYGEIDICISRGTVNEHLLSNIDFTMNMLAQDIENLDMYNPVGGLEDIKNKKIKLNPTQDNLTFSPRSIIRAARFMCKFGFEIDIQTMIILDRDKNLIFDLIHPYIIAREMQKLFKTKNNELGIILLNQFGIYDKLFNIYENELGDLKYL